MRKRKKSDIKLMRVSRIDDFSYLLFCTVLRNITFKKIQKGFSGYSVRQLGFWQELENIKPVDGILLISGTKVIFNRKMFLFC